MRLQDDIDFTTLTWVKGELDETLKQARHALEAFVEDPTDVSQMRFCATYLHQVQGTLRMVELYGAAMVTEEMERVASALIGDSIGNRDEAYTVLMRGIVQLPDYLERLQSGHKDIPIVLLPLLNDLRAARGEKGLSESVLFTPDLTRALPGSARGPEKPFAPEQLNRVAELLRQQFQISLLKWFKNEDPATHVAKLAQTCDKLVTLLAQEDARRLFWVSAGLLTALRERAFDPPAPLKQAFGKVEREIKRLADQGEAGFRLEPPRELTRTLLYFAAHAPTQHGRIAELRQTFDLDKLLPSEEELRHAQGSISGHNRALLDTVSAAIKEDLLRVKDALDLHMRTQSGDTASLATQAEVLGRVADTLGMLGLGVPRGVVVEQRQAIEEVAAGRRPADESSLLDIAGALLYVESSLDDQVQHLGSGGGIRDAAQADARKVLDALIKEAQANFAQAKQCFVAFVESNWDHTQLQDVPRLLDEVGGALRILELDEPPRYLAAIGRFTEAELLGRHRVPNGQQLDTLADALASLEYYLEALREHRAGRERILDVARQRLEALGYWPIPEAGAASVLDDVPVAASPLDAVVAPPAPAPAPVAADTVAATSAVVAEAPAPIAAVAPAADAEPAAAAPAAASESSAAESAPGEIAAAAPVAAEAVVDALPDEAASLGFELAGEDIDEEIREVFIEEVQEEINNLGELFPIWKANPESAEQLKPIRRVFHTLKGSGRLVGAMTLGEFSWKIENMLNRVLDQTIRPDAGVVEIIAVARDVLPELLSALKGEQRIRSNLDGIKHAAERMAAGELLSPAQVRAASRFAAPPAPVVVAPAVPSEPAAPAVTNELPEPVAIEPAVEEPVAVEPVAEAHAVAEPSAAGEGVSDFDAALEAELAALAAETEAAPVETAGSAAGDGLAELEAALAEAERAFVETPVDVTVDEVVAESVSLSEPVHGMVDEAVPSDEAASGQPPVDAIAALRSNATAFAIDSVLFDILKAEVAGHLETVDEFIARSRAHPEPVNDPLLRAVHTMSGAFAMTEVPHITEVVGPLEGYIKRLIAQRATPSAVGIGLMAEAADAIRTLMQALEAEPPFAPQFSTLAERLVGLRDTLAEPTGPLLPMHDEVEHFDHAEPVSQAGMETTQPVPALSAVEVEEASAVEAAVEQPMEFAGLAQTDLSPFDTTELESALRDLPSIDETGDARVLEGEAETLDIAVTELEAAPEVADAGSAVDIVDVEPLELRVVESGAQFDAVPVDDSAETPPDATAHAEVIEPPVAAEEAERVEPAEAPAEPVVEVIEAVEAIHLAEPTFETVELAADSVEGELAVAEDAFEELSLDDVEARNDGAAFDIVEHDFSDELVEDAELVAASAATPAAAEHDTADADAASLVALLLSDVPGVAPAEAGPTLAEMDEAAIETALGATPELAALESADAEGGDAVAAGLEAGEVEAAPAEQAVEVIEMAAADDMVAEVVVAEAESAAEEAIAESAVEAEADEAFEVEAEEADAEAPAELAGEPAADLASLDAAQATEAPLEGETIEAVEVEAIDLGEIALLDSAHGELAGSDVEDTAQAAAGETAIAGFETADAREALADEAVMTADEATEAAAGELAVAEAQDEPAEAAHEATAEALDESVAAGQVEPVRAADAIETVEEAAPEAADLAEPAAAEATGQQAADEAAAAFVARTAAAAAASSGLAAMLAGSDPDPDGPLQLADMDEELLDIFLEEGVDILDHSDGLLAKLRDNPSDRELVVGLQRDLHTLKGGARMAGIVPIGDLGHAAESLLEAVADGRRDLGGVGMEVLERVFDRLHGMVTRVGERRALAMPTVLLGYVDALVRGEALEFSPAAEAEVEAAPAQPAATGPATPAEEAPRVVPTPAPVPAAVAKLTALDTALDDDEAAVRAPQEQIRIRADLLDRLVNYAGEVAIYRARLEQQVGSFRGGLMEMEATTNRLREQLRRLEIETEAQIIARYQREQDEGEAQNFDPLELDRFSNLQQLSRALSESAADLTNLQGTLEDLTRQYETLLLQQSRVSSELQEGLMRTRMVPFDALVPRLRRILRQTASELGKKAQLKVEGAQGEMDRNVLDRMTAPLEHMLRNALAHGLEMPADREKLGKPAEGTVRIHVSREASEVVIRVSDDGRGMDRDAIRRKAIERGLMDPEAQLSDRDLYGFVLESGFSTAQSVSKIAGRGVGMDVVHSEIKQLGGSLYIDSEFGRGTEFVIRLPFTLAVTQAVFVKLGETHYAIPITSVQGVARIAPADLAKQQESGDAHFDYAGERYSVYDLGLLLGHQAVRAAESLQVPLLLARSGDLRAAICVDQVIGSREIVVKPTGPQINSIPGIFGATVMGDGSVVVILDVAPLVRRAAALHAIGETLAPAEPEIIRQIPLVMVVDDSITMRKVSGRVLERAGYEVMTAKDGVDAIEKMQERVPDAMLLDIEMPRMDGYELATHMRNDTRLRNVPIIMITSRTGEKHRQRAFEIGVDRYLGKPYQEPELLRNVQEVLKVGRGRTA